MDAIHRVHALIFSMEKLIRMHDQLDEQLHAGFYSYIMTAPNRFVSNAVAIYPVFLVFLGFLIP